MSRLFGRDVLVSYKTNRFGVLVILNNLYGAQWVFPGAKPIEYLPYQLDCSVLDYNGDNG